MPAKKTTPEARMAYDGLRVLCVDTIADYPRMTRTTIAARIHRSQPNVGEALGTHHAKWSRPVLALIADTLTREPDIALSVRAKIRGELGRCLPIFIQDAPSETRQVLTRIQQSLDGHGSR
jgi:hypothetical protein